MQDKTRDSQTLLSKIECILMQLLAEQSEKMLSIQV